MNNNAIDYLLSIKDNKQNFTMLNNELTDVLCSNKSSENLSITIKIIIDILKELKRENTYNIYLGYPLSIALEALLPYVKDNPKFKTFLLALYTYDFEKLTIEQIKSYPKNLLHYLDEVKKIKTQTMLKKEAERKNLAITELRGNGNAIYTIFSVNNNQSKLIEQFKSYSEVEIFINRYGKM